MGLPAVLGAASAPHRAVCQLAGAAWRLPAAAFAAEADRDGPTRARLGRYAQALLVMTAQGALCNARHPVARRAARWLLLARDRAGTDDLPLTHEFLAQMLAVRRASVTDALAPLQAAGLLRQDRGRVVLRDRPGLEAAACPCYALIRDEYAALAAFAGRGAPPRRPDAGAPGPVRLRTGVGTGTYRRVMLSGPPRDAPPAPTGREPRGSGGAGAWRPGAPSTPAGRGVADRAVLGRVEFPRRRGGRQGRPPRRSALRGASPLRKEHADARDTARHGATRPDTARHGAAGVARDERPAGGGRRRRPPAPARPRPGGRGGFLARRRRGPGGAAVGGAHRGADEPPGGPARPRPPGGLRGRRLRRPRRRPAAAAPGRRRRGPGAPLGSARTPRRRSPTC